MAEQATIIKERYYFIDALRGFALAAMVIHHLIFNLVLFEIVPPWVEDNLFIRFMQLWITPIFFLASGIASSFSRNNIKRGLMILGCALAVSIATYFFNNEMYVKFGVLHFMGIATLLQGILKNTKNLKINPLIPFCLFWILKFLLHGVFAPFDGLAWLGFPSVTYTSSDYFPIIPWIFAYYTGVFCAPYIVQHKLPKKLYSFRCKFFEGFGRHSLVIYLAHQPVILGLMLAVQYLVSL